MELDRHETNIAVRKILDQIVNNLVGYRWERLCTFSDGSGFTVVEVSLYRKGGSEMAARISYQVETGDLLNFSYRNDTNIQADNVVDLLLDIHNCESNRFGKQE